MVNPSSDENIDQNIDVLESYDGLIWGGSSLNIYNDTPEIKRQIEFMKELSEKNQKNFSNLLGHASSSNSSRWRSQKMLQKDHIEVLLQI